MSTINSMLDTLNNDPIREFQHECNQLSQRAEALRPVVKAVEEAIQRSALKNAAINIKSQNNTYPKVLIIVVTERIDELVPLFRELVKEGIHTNKTEPYKDHNYMGLFGMREYNCGQVLINAVIMPADKEDDTGCRMIQTGVKEVPVFEMVCPDKPKP